MISTRIFLVILVMTVINTFVSEMTVDAIRRYCDPRVCDRECLEKGKYFGRCFEDICKCT
ncbi:peptide II.10.10 [Centruroides sculpturatus]|uniref:peptide II.10.10 n=1 Tax=Centruroides sculpturatus TaxID=218467 RepID=UPI000C6E6089|nr:peptide II.10.10 [Centruroides sculpturatus]